MVLRKRPWPRPLSSKYQVVIPKAVRERARLEPGQRLTMVVRGSVVSLVPRVPAGPLRGFVRGIDTSGSREKSDRL
ncbi:MAG: AbrB/MazE/SpoVT family DNA-binding domain-containing protein [Armatimonadia bacterium]|nr:AbrB/MazE/SpoVT family DNA-binding domain-containing protein [Armatimonadia bacterium]